MKQEGAEQKFKQKNEYLSEKNRINTYSEVKDGDYIISAISRKTGARFKLFVALEAKDEVKLFLVEINSAVLRDF